MADILEIDKAITDVLNNKFPLIEVYSNDVKEGFARPCFYTKIVPLTSEYETKNIMSHKKMIVIHYFSKEEKDGIELDNIEMNDNLYKAFGMTLQVGQRSFLLKNIRSEVVDTTLQFRFDLNYLSEIDNIDKHQKATEIDVEIKRSEN